LTDEADLAPQFLAADPRDGAYRNLNAICHFWTRFVSNSLTNPGRSNLRSNSLRDSALTGDAFPAGAKPASLTPNRGEKVTEPRQSATTSPSAAAPSLAKIAMSPRFRWGPRRAAMKTNAAEQLRRSAAELWGNHEVTEEYNHSSGGAEPIASPHRIDQRAV